MIYLFLQELTEPEVVRQAEELEAALVGQNQGALQQLCQDRAAKAAKPEDKETWEFIRVLFADDARRCAHCSLEAVKALPGSVFEP